MIAPATNNVIFFESCSNIGSSEPYAVISSCELASILKHFIHWAVIIGNNPEIAEIFGKSSTAHIKLATVLRDAIKKSLKEGTYPNMILPIRKFTAMMTLSRISNVLEAEFHETFNGDIHRWE